MELEKNTSVIQKAIRLNRDVSRYGSFAEIGAGQEVVRWFFHVGGASGTVAKSISAYDMKFSDAIYGPSERYVSRQRLIAMLSHEYYLLIERLFEDKGDTTTFFAFANTIAASGYRCAKTGHGWMGIRFQAKPKSQPNDIILHVRMLDKDNQKQQEMLGILGVNLIYGAMYYTHDPLFLISLLKEGLENEPFEVDLIHFSGPDFVDVDNRVINLELVKQKLTNAVIFKSDGGVIQASEMLYKKPILIERGVFRPVTNVAIDILKLSLEQFCQEFLWEKEHVAVLMELSTKSFDLAGEFDQEDFLARVEMLQKLNKNILISNYSRDFDLASFLANYTDKKIAFAMGIPHLKQIFLEDLYEDLDGGILESLGRLFKKNVKFYIYPIKDISLEKIHTIDNFEVADNLKHLYKYLLENSYIESIHAFNPELRDDMPKDIIDKIRKGDQSWESQVPLEVRNLIKENKYFCSVKMNEDLFSNLYF
jgi:hypothetical protein